MYFEGIGIFSKPHIFPFSTCMALTFQKIFYFFTLLNLFSCMTAKGAIAAFKYEISLIVSLCRENNQL